MRANMTADKRGGAFGPEVEFPADATPYDALAAFAGRRVPHPDGLPDTPGRAGSAGSAAG